MKKFGFAQANEKELESGKKEVNNKKTFKEYYVNISIWLCTEIFLLDFFQRLLWIPTAIGITGGWVSSVYFQFIT